MEPDQAIDNAHAALTNDDLDDETALHRVVEVLSAAHPTWSWVGIYLLVGDTLALGPYVGPDTEHTRIPVGTGICGAAAETGRNMVVGNVKAVDNYLACSPGTQSELVVLIRDDGDIVGVIDIDSDDLDAFSPADIDSLRPLTAVAGPRCGRLAATLS
ncbi:MAG TPA: GAF domain-containing protein [Acidimicrobiia bacterium]|jgi:GAF domain-containing protein|nr:GAF domain-containing protein [Acidimicrobiia bacterium]